MRIAIDQNELTDFCRKHGVKRLSVFGSVLREDFDPQASDVDLLVEFAPGASKNVFKLLQMQSALSEMFGREVDLVTPNSLSKYFRDNVLAAAKVLFDVEQLKAVIGKSD
jgi:predicted nucleotidyltransferase